MKVSVRELKNRLSEYLRRVQSGEEIVVTSHGEPVGRLVGPTPPSVHPEDDALARLRAQPWVRPGNGRKTASTGKPAKVPPGTTDDLLRWVRGG
ncbi:MAG: type II toxin-antitoxin system prevent-host-death family antitoxin [Woeseia sp.]